MKGMAAMRKTNGNTKLQPNRFREMCVVERFCLVAIAAFSSPVRAEEISSRNAMSLQTELKQDVATLKEKPKKLPQIAWEFSGGSPVLGRRFDMGSHVPGGPMTVELTLINKGHRAVKFSKLDLPCKCTTANVPQGVVEVGDVVETKFTFDTPRSPRKLSETFLATIKSDDEDDSPAMHLSFQFAWNGVVAFDRSEALIVYNSRLSEVRGLIPVVVSDQNELQFVKIELSQEISFAKAKLVEENENVYLELIFEPVKFGASETTDGEIVLISGKGLRSNALCTLKRELPIRIIPASTFFAPSAEKGCVAKSTAVLKLGRTHLDEKQSVVEVSCRTSTGKPIKSRMSEVGVGTYRLEIAIDKYEDIEGVVNLIWKVVYSGGNSEEIATSLGSSK